MFSKTAISIALILACLGPITLDMSLERHEPTLNTGIVQLLVLH